MRGSDAPSSRSKAKSSAPVVVSVVAKQKRQKISHNNVDANTPVEDMPVGRNVIRLGVPSGLPFPELAAALHARNHPVLDSPLFDPERDITQEEALTEAEAAELSGIFGEDSDSEEEILNESVVEEEPTQLDTQPTQLAAPLHAFVAAAAPQRDEGEEDADRILPEKWDKPQALEFDRLELYADAVKNMIEVVGNTDQLNTALFAMSCTIVFDSVTTNMNVMSSTNVFLSAATTFDNHMVTFPLKTYARNNLLKHFPNQTWPQGYVDYINKKKSKKPTDSALTKQAAVFAGLNDEQQKACVFGKVIKDKHRDTKAFVNMSLVPKYTPEEMLKSGHTREQMLRALRRTLWPTEANKRGLDCMRSNVARLKKANLTAMDPEESKACFLAARERSFRKLSDNFHPPEFLVFLLFSVPAEDPAQVLLSLSLGKGTVEINPTITAPAQALNGTPPHSPARGINQVLQQGRSARRLAEMLAADGGARNAVVRGRGAGAVVDGPGTAAPALPIAVVHTHVVEAAPLDKQIQALEKIIAILSKRNMDNPDNAAKVAEREDELLGLLEQQRRG